MKIFSLLICTLSTLCALDEVQQVKKSHPLQSTLDSKELLCNMQDDVLTYLYETPRSSYDYFYKHRKNLSSDEIITWIHGNIYLKNLSATQEDNVFATLNSEENAHLGDYRYDLFTLLSDLLLKMQYESDFSGSKEKAVLGNLVDGYFARLADKDLKCSCINEALDNVKQTDVLSQFTKIKKRKRIFNFGLKKLTKLKDKKHKKVLSKVQQYIKKNNLKNLLPIKSIAKNNFGNYLLLCDGKSPQVQDDLVLTLAAKTLSVSYQIDTQMKKEYHKKSLRNHTKLISSFNKSDYPGSLKIDQQNFFISKLNPKLNLKPQSEQTRPYKNYASALGFMLSSFHSNTKIKACQDFSRKVKKEVKVRHLKNELISMVYAYNDELENSWELFSEKHTIKCAAHVAANRR